MKTFTSVSEWLSTNPSEASQNTVLNAINRNVKAQMRIDQYYLNQKIKRGEKALAAIPNLDELNKLKEEFERREAELKGHKGIDKVAAKGDKMMKK